MARVGLLFIVGACFGEMRPVFLALPVVVGIVALSLCTAVHQTKSAKQGSVTRAADISPVDPTTSNLHIPANCGLFQSVKSASDQSCFLFNEIAKAIFSTGHNADKCNVLVCPRKGYKNFWDLKHAPDQDIVGLFDLVMDVAAKHATRDVGKQLTPGYTPPDLSASQLQGLEQANYISIYANGVGAEQYLHVHVTDLRKKDRYYKDHSKGFIKDFFTAGGVTQSTDSGIRVLTNARGTVLEADWKDLAVAVKLAASKYSTSQKPWIKFFSHNNGPGRKLYIGIPA